MRIVDTISAPFAIDGNPIEIGTSIGITLAPRDGADADKLLKNADLALYRTKGAGRCGYSFFETQMDEQIQLRRTLEIDLRRALAEEALELVYQPIVCVQSEQVTGFEALLRWDHPERGTIPPAEFIAIAEEVGLIADIGDWALQRACAQAARWPAPISVAINVSALQFTKRNLVESVLHALAQSGLPPDRLELEITETVLLQEGQNTLAMLHQLRQLGIRIAMDDFGTGYCSLTNLRAFPFDKIKVDRAFIREVERSGDSRAIVESVLALGKSLGMTTVAEGIENFEQLAMLRSWGCEQAQGYLLSPPVSAAAVDSLLSERSASARGAVQGASPVNPASGGNAAPPMSSRAA
jgi:predicted signal transduction protein with EAL and GGDEF domain